MKNTVSRNLLLGAALLCALPAPAAVAGDVVDLLSYDTLPAARPLAAEQVPLPAENPPVSVVTAVTEKPAPAPEPVAEAAARPTPPVAMQPHPVKLRPVLKAAPKPLKAQHPQVVAAKAAPAAVESPKAAEAPVVPAPPVPVAAPVAVPIAAGDSLRIAVEGEADLSGTYQVKPDGMVALPLVGDIRAQGFTPAKLAEMLTSTLKDGYLVDPKITIEAILLPASGPASPPSQPVKAAH